MSSDKSGQCLCGSVKYKVKNGTDDRDVLSCFCLDCQRCQGVPCSLCMMIPEKDFEIIEGAPKTFAKKGDSGNLVTRNFCGDCGTQLFTVTPTYAGLIILKAGSLGNLDKVEPKLYLYGKRKPTWCQVPENAKVDMSEFPVSKLVESVNTPLPPIKPNDLSGKIVVVTGANTGIGYVTAKEIASMNPEKLILACRNAEKGEAAVKSIKEATKFGNIECWLLDLASFTSVQEFSKRFVDSGLPLDILVSNAGLGVMPEWTENENGYEITVLVNHLSNMLLISELYPALKKSADSKKDLEHHFPRVNVVASDVHNWAFNPLPEDPSPVSSVLKKGQNVQYFSSKLFNVLFARAFARKCPVPIWICSSNPGYTESELGSKDPKTGASHGTPHARPGPFEKQRTTYEGAKTIIHASITPEVSESGSYYSEMKPSKPRDSVLGNSGEKFADNVWNDSISILKKHVASSPIYDW